MSNNSKTDGAVTLGRKKFILYYGVLGWGLATAAIFVALTYYKTGRVELLPTIACLVLFPLGGIAWGYVMWGFLKKTAHKRAGSSH